MIATAQVLATARDAWRGTVLVVFQPGEETAQGARAMTADWDARGLPHADVVLGGTDPARLIRCENAHGAARCTGVCSLPRRPAPGDFQPVTLPREALGHTSPEAALRYALLAKYMDGLVIPARALLVVLYDTFGLAQARALAQTP